MDNHQQQNGDQLLSGWKAIAGYLGRDIRTCQRFEKLNRLPIRRFGEGRKSSVFAMKAELDEWLIKTPIQNGRPESKSTEERSNIPRKKCRLWATSVLSVGMIGIGFVFFGSRDLQPADFSIENSTILIRNAKGRILWSFDTQVENLLPELAPDRSMDYRRHFQLRQKPDFGQIAWPFLHIKDINADGWAEVLFTIKTLDESGEGRLICLDREGTEMWSKQTGRMQKYGSSEYSNEYRISAIFSSDFNLDGFSEIVVASDHRWGNPSQLMIFDHAGNLIGEYWNYGRYTDFAVGDINQDSRPELLVACINGEYGQGCLMVFDPMDVHGGSTQTSADFQNPAIERGSELFNVRIPRTDVDLLTAEPVEAIREVEIHKDGRIVAMTNLSNITFSFHFDMSIDAIWNSNTFVQKRELARRYGQIRNMPDAIYLEGLKKEVLYLDGDKREWVKNPEMSNPWRKNPQ